MTPAPQATNVREAPEHHNDRRAFIVWALMLGVIPPERVTERVLEELEAVGQEPTP